MEETGSEIVCAAPTTLAVKGYMMMMMNVIKNDLFYIQRAHFSRVSCAMYVKVTACIGGATKTGISDSLCLKQYLDVRELCS